MRADDFSDAVLAPPSHLLKQQGNPVFRACLAHCEEVLDCLDKILGLWSLLGLFERFKAKFNDYNEILKRMKNEREL